MIPTTPLTAETAKPGLICKTPSGLGGVFTVEIIEVTEDGALVRNKGNCEDFDEAAPYRRPFDQLHTLK